MTSLPLTNSPQSSVAEEGSARASVRPQIVELQAGVNREQNFRILFERYHGVIYRFFFKRGFSHDECEDLTQEVFFKICKSIDSFRADGPFEGWLFQVAANVYRNTIRDKSASKRNVREDSLESFLDDFLQLADSRVWSGERPTSSPLDSFLEKERLDILAKALSELPEQMRRCLALRIHQELKYREIAVVMRISVETVKAHLYQARQRLKVILEAYFQETKSDYQEKGV